MASLLDHLGAVLHNACPKSGEISRKFENFEQFRGFRCVDARRELRLYRTPLETPYPGTAYHGYGWTTQLSYPQDPPANVYRKEISPTYP